MREVTPTCASGRRSAGPRGGEGHKAIRPSWARRSSRRAAGCAPATLRSYGPEATLAFPAGRPIFDSQGAAAPASPLLRDQGSNLGLLLQGRAWCRLHHLAPVWTGRLELPTPGFRSRRAADCATSSRCRRRARRDRYDGRIRTDGRAGLRAVPLPVGLRQRGPDEPRTRTVPLQGSCAASRATGPVCVGVSRGRGSNPLVEAYETSRLPEPRFGRCDRPGSNRLPPGPRPGVSTTSASEAVCRRAGRRRGIGPPVSKGPLGCGRLPWRDRPSGPGGADPIWPMPVQLSRCAWRPCCRRHEKQSRNRPGRNRASDRRCCEPLRRHGASRDSSERSVVQEKAELTSPARARVGGFRLPGLTGYRQLARG
jgi:hypothetical protein